MIWIDEPPLGSEPPAGLQQSPTSEAGGPSVGVGIALVTKAVHQPSLGESGVELRTMLIGHLVPDRGLGGLVVWRCGSALGGDAQGVHQHVRHLASAGVTDVVANSSEPDGVQI